MSTVKGSDCESSLRLCWFACRFGNKAVLSWYDVTLNSKVAEVQWVQSSTDLLTEKVRQHPAVNIVSSLCLVHSVSGSWFTCFYMFYKFFSLSWSCQLNSAELDFARLQDMNKQSSELVVKTPLLTFITLWVLSTLWRQHAVSETNTLLKDYRYVSSLRTDILMRTHCEVSPFECLFNCWYCIDMFLNGNHKQEYSKMKQCNRETFLHIVSITFIHKVYCTLPSIYMQCLSIVW